MNFFSIFRESDQLTVLLLFYEKRAQPRTECSKLRQKKFLWQYRTNRQESLTRDFSSEKGGKPQEYFVYFKFSQRICEGKGPSKPVDAIVRCCPRFYKRISGGKDLGDPAKAQRQRVWWGKEEQRSDWAFAPKGQNEGYEACDDAIRRRICVVLP